MLSRQEGRRRDGQGRGFHQRPCLVICRHLLQVELAVEDALDEGPHSGGVKHSGGSIGFLESRTSTSVSPMATSTQLLLAAPE